jgi:hypothetical protein
LNILGNYNHNNEGVITEEFLNLVISEATKDGKFAHYITLKGYYNLPNTLELQQLLNIMYSKGFSFKEFISQDRNIFAEMLFVRN